MRWLRTEQEKVWFHEECVTRPCLPGPARQDQVPVRPYWAGPHLPCSRVCTLAFAGRGGENSAPGLCARRLDRHKGGGQGLKDLILALEDNQLVPRSKALSYLHPYVFADSDCVQASA